MEMLKDKSNNVIKYNEDVMKVIEEFVKKVQEVKKITEGIQEKKGKGIVIADLTGIDDTICDYFVICEGNTPTQVAAITDSVEDYVRINANEKPIGIDGLRNAQWVAMDYSNVLVHIFLPEVRDFYNLDKLYDDAPVVVEF